MATEALNHPSERSEAQLPILGQDVEVQQASGSDVKDAEPNVNDLVRYAKLAGYAYTSGNPAITVAKWKTKCPEGYSWKGEPERLYTHSYFRAPESQPRFFKSHAYVCKLEEERASEIVNRIVVGFRGTWLHEGIDKPAGGQAPAAPSAPSPSASPAPTAKRSVWLSKLPNIAFNIIAPSNYGLSDLYYDAYIMRVPYRKGVVWKWYAYWGTLLLTESNRIRDYFPCPRKIAAGLITKPEGCPIGRSPHGLVHLGFWALWASDEGFSGYNRQGHLWKDQESPETSVILPKSRESVKRAGVLQSVLKAVLEAEPSQRMEILVVGHSLGGAVSCFAALDIVAELAKLQAEFPLEKIPEVKVIHATFGAPPVGTKVFTEYFHKQMEKHQTWAVYHERDFVARCFDWCASSKWVSWFGWWTDWSHAGTKIIIREPPLPDTLPKGGIPWGTICKALLTIDGWKALFVVGGALGFLGVTGTLAMPLSVLAIPFVWWVDWDYFKRQQNPGKDWNGAGVEGRCVEDNGVQNQGAVQDRAIVNNQIVQDHGAVEDKSLDHVSSEYHKLARYIRFLEDTSSDPFEVVGTVSESVSSAGSE